MSFAIFPSSYVNQEQFVPDYNQQHYQRCSSFQLHSSYDQAMNYSYNGGNQQQCQHYSSYPIYNTFNSHQGQNQWQPTHTSNKLSLNSNYTSSQTNMLNCNNNKNSNHNNKSSNSTVKNRNHINTKLDKKIKKKNEPKKDTTTDKKSFKQKYKTQICNSWQVNGYCRFGDQCAFAHGNLQLKQKTHVPNNYKTQICKQFRQKMYCPYGARCQYLHQSQSLLRGELPFTSMLRMNFQHLATRLQAQATAKDQDIFKTLMQKGAKFKNFYPRERLPIFKQICEMGKTKSQTTNTSSQLPCNNNLVYTTTQVQQKTITEEANEKQVEKSIERKLSEVISDQGTAADSEEEENVNDVKKIQKCIHSDGDDDDENEIIVDI